MVSQDFEARKDSIEQFKLESIMVTQLVKQLAELPSFA